MCGWGNDAVERERLQGFRTVWGSNGCSAKIIQKVISSPPLLAQGLIRCGSLMRIEWQVFWLRGHSLPFRPSRSRCGQWLVVWKGASPVTAAQPLPNCPSSPASVLGQGGTDARHSLFSPATRRGTVRSAVAPSAQES